MEGLRELVYSVLVISVSGAVITMFAPEKSETSRFLHFLVSIAVTSVLLLPLGSVAGKLPELASYDIEFDIKSGDADVFTETVTEQACRNIENELSQGLYERFDVSPLRVEVFSNGEAQALLIESVKVYYGTENSLLYSDTVNYVKKIFGIECEVNVMYEDTEP